MKNNENTIQIAPQPEPAQLYLRLLGELNNHNLPPAKELALVSAFWRALHKTGVVVDTPYPQPTA